MNLMDIIHRNMDLKPWSEGEKIPWNDPDFSRRMLKEHLTQKHDAASRRTSRIKKHVNWIHQHVLAEKTSRILDLGCGPGLYASRLASLGHTCTGIDFSPASVEYAVKNSPENCTYHLADIRSAEYGFGYGLAVFIFGELNAFRRDDARLILEKACGALDPGGHILLEVSTLDGIDQIGNQPSTWYSADAGLFSDKPHIFLMENFWDEEQTVATERILIIDAASGQVTRYAASLQGYSNEQYRALLAESGFGNISFYPSLTGKEEHQPDEMVVILAQK